MSHWGPQSITASLFGAVMVFVSVLGMRAIGRELVLLARIRRAGVSATGTVVKHVKGSRGVDRPVIRFTDQRGQHIEFVPRRALSKFVPKGEEFSVRYLADEPQKARLASWEARSHSLLLFTLMCLVFLVVGLMLAIGVLPQASRGGPDYSGHTGIIVILTVSSVAGLCILGIGSYWIYSTLMMRRDGITTTGTIVRVFTQGSGQGTSRKAVIEFVDTNQRRRQFVANSPSRRAGGAVPVAYWPGRPDKARVASVSRTAYSVAVCTLFCMVVDCLVLLFH